MTDLTDFVNVMASAEDWLAAGASDRETAAPPGEPMKRFTIDVPVSLHRRIKTACARRGLKTSTGGAARSAALRGAHLIATGPRSPIPM